MAGPPTLHTDRLTGGVDVVQGHVERDRRAVDGVDGSDFGAGAVTVVGGRDGRSGDRIAHAFGQAHTYRYTDTQSVDVGDLDLCLTRHGCHHKRSILARDRPNRLLIGEAGYRTVRGLRVELDAEAEPR